MEFRVKLVTRSSDREARPARAVCLRDPLTFTPVRSMKWDLVDVSRVSETGMGDPGRNSEYRTRLCISQGSFRCGRFWQIAMKVELEAARIAS